MDNKLYLKNQLEWRLSESSIKEEQRLDLEEKRLKPEELQEIILSAINVGTVNNLFEGTINNLFDNRGEEHYIKYIQNKKVIRYDRDALFDKKYNSLLVNGIDLLMGIKTEPNAEFELKINDSSYFKTYSDNNGFIIFETPINTAATPYNRIYININKDDKKIKLFTINCITIMDKDTRDKVKRISSKNIPWKLHSSMEEPFCYYRGTCILWSQRYNIF